jgi:hypothetical protein
MEVLLEGGSIAVAPEEVLREGCTAAAAAAADDDDDAKGVVQTEERSFVGLTMMPQTHRGSMRDSWYPLRPAAAADVVGVVVPAVPRVWVPGHYSPQLCLRNTCWIVYASGVSW